MLNKERNLKRFVELLEENEDLLTKVNSKIEKELGEDGPDLFEILEEGISSYKKRPMYITDALIGKNKSRGYAVEFANREGELEISSAYRVEDGKVSVGLVGLIREMAYCGYELRQPKEKEIVEVFKDM